MKPPCDEAVILSANPARPCAANTARWILAATILGSSIAFIDGTVVNIALPTFQRSLNASVVDVQWVVESYGLVLAAMLLLGGSLGDLYGRRLMFLLGVSVFAAASIACGASRSMHQMVVGRSIQGLGAAFLVPGSLSIISASFDEKSRGSAIGTWAGFTSITAAVGPVLGGWLIEHTSWRWIFFINVPLAIAVILVSLRHVPESKNEGARHVDWWGAILATAGLAGLVYGFVESVNLHWTHPAVFGSVIAGIFCLVAFLLVERRAHTPMVPLTLFLSKAFTGANLLTLFLYAATGILFFLYPLNLVQVQGYSSTATGAAALPLILLMFLLSRWSGGLVMRYGPRAPLVVGPLIAAAGFVLFARPSVAPDYWTSFLPAFLVLGFGMAVSVAPLTTVVMGSVSQDHSGAASGINNAVARLAGVLAVAVFGVVMVHAFSSHLNRELATIAVPPDALDAIHANATRLAAIGRPAGLDSIAAAAVHSAIRGAFVFGFRIVMLICAALAVMGALIAWRMIPVQPKQLQRATVQP
jgi:EmrB/QacA subfamily drug resistance transporter